MRAISVISGSIASAAGICGAAAATLFFGAPEWESPNFPNILTIVGLTGLSAFILTAVVVENRTKRSLSPLGFPLGGLLAVIVLLLGTTTHAVFYSGAAGFFISVGVQMLFAILFMGWLVFLVGGIVGLAVNKLSRRSTHRPNKGFNRTPESSAAAAPGESGGGAG